MSKARIGEIKTALVALLQGSSAAAAGRWQVKRLTSQDLGEENQIIIRPPAVLVWYAGDGGRWTPKGQQGFAGNTRYDVWEPFVLFVVARFKASEEKQDEDADVMIEAVRAALVNSANGGKLVLPGGVETHIWFTGSAAWQGFTPELATVYGLPLQVHGHWDAVE